MICHLTNHRHQPGALKPNDHVSILRHHRIKAEWSELHSAFSVGGREMAPHPELDTLTILDQCAVLSVALFLPPGPEFLEQLGAFPVLAGFIGIIGALEQESQ